MAEVQGLQGGNKQQEAQPLVVLPRISILEPRPFNNMFITGLDDGTECTFSKYSNYTRLGGAADNTRGLHCHLERP